MTATSATSSSKLNRAEVLVDGESDILMDVISTLEPGDYPITHVDTDPTGMFGFKVPGSDFVSWTRYMTAGDPHESERTYTLRVIQERASIA